MPAGDSARGHSWFLNVEWKLVTERSDFIKQSKINNRQCSPATISDMKSAILLLALVSAVSAQSAPTSATVPITLDHNRVIIDVYLPLPDGNSKRVRAWVDNGNPDLSISARAAELMGIKPAGETESSPGHKVPTAPPPKAITIGGMPIPLTTLKEARIEGQDAIAPGMSAAINLPSTLLRQYDVLINYPDREFTIAQPGTLHFNGIQSKALINGENGLFQIPSKIENKSYNLALDAGSNISFLSADLMENLIRSHPTWPHMTGAVGIANMWGSDEEPAWQLFRLPRLQYGPLFLTDIVFAPFDEKTMEFFEKRAGMKTAGLVGGNALLNYRVGLDYKHDAVYFDLGSTFKAPDMDVVGLILRPEKDERYTILGIADYEGKPSVAEVQKGDVLISVDSARATGATMGQVWSSLEGMPGQQRTLVLERNGKQFEVKATVRRFLAPLEKTPR